MAKRLYTILLENVVGMTGTKQMKNWTKVCRLLLLDKQLQTLNNILECCFTPTHVVEVYEGDRLVWKAGALVDSNNYETRCYKRIYHPMTPNGLKEMKLAQILQMRHQWADLLCRGR